MAIPLRRCSAGLLGILLAVLSCSRPAGAEPERVRVEDALDHIGERVTVCGKVVESSHLPHQRGGPTYLNLVRPYPHPAFTVVIWARYRSTFDPKPEEFYLDKTICVTGVVQRYREWPRIEVRSPDGLRVIDTGLDAGRFGPEERAVIRATLVALGYEAEDGGDWTGETDRALAAFLTDHGFSGDEDGWPQTLSALGESAATLSAEQSLGIVRLFLLHLAERETQLTVE